MMTRPKNYHTLLKTDYQTSSGSGHIYIHPVEQTYEHGENPQLPHIKNNRDCELLCKTYLTTNGEEHDFKYNVHKNTEVSVLPIHCARQTFMRSTDEKLRKSNWLPLKTTDTEYSSRYIQKKGITLTQKVSALGPLSVCQSGGLWLHQQSAVPLSKNSIAKYLDPYVSTTHTTHTQFSDDQIRKIGRNDAITFYRMDLTSELSMCTQPVYDAVMFKDKTSSRTVFQTACRVPHKGMQSEMQAKFVHPYQHEFSSKTWQCGAQFLANMPLSSPQEMLSAPNMYRTEYCHIGTGWPVREVISTGKCCL